MKFKKITSVSNHSRFELAEERNRKIENKPIVIMQAKNRKKE